jgi:hypothetical protein
MRSTKYYNNLDSSVIKKFGLDRLTDTVILRLLDVRMDPDNPSQPIIPVYKKIPNRDVVIIDGVSYDIGAISSVSGDKISFYEIGFWKDEGGFKRLNPRTARDRDILEFLLLSNFNGSNPFRDPNVRPLFEVFRPEEKAKQRVDQRLQRVQAITIAASMTEEELREFAASVGWNEAEDVYVLKDKALDWCDRDPKGFVEAQSSRERYIMATLRRAEARDIIAKNILENAWVWKASNQTICSLPRNSERDMYQSFVDWYMSNDVAVKIFHELESIIYGRNHVTKLSTPEPEPQEEEVKPRRGRTRTEE